MVEPRVQRFRSRAPQAAARSGRVSCAVARVLAVVGTIATGLPLAAPVVLAVILLVLAQGLHLDFLMPGELFPLVLGGGAAVAVAAFLLGRFRGWSLTLVLLAATLLLAVTLTPEATGVAVVVTAYSGYVLSAAGIVVVGVLVCRAAFARREG